MDDNLPVIKQAAGANSATHHDFQHELLSGQAAQRAEVCLCAPVCVRVHAHLHVHISLPAYDHVPSCHAEDPPRSRKVQPVSKHPPGNKI